MKDRLFALFSIAALYLSSLLVSALAFALELLAWPIGGTHRHLIPGTARSIVETRRMGLA